MPIVTIRLSDEEYKVLRKKAMEKGVSSIADYIKMVAEKEASSESRGLGLKSQSSILRVIQDMINPYTSKIDRIAVNIADLIERVESIEDRIARLEASIDELKERISELKIQQPTTTVRVRRARPSAIERLRDEGYVMQEDLKWLSNPRAFFEKLRREGAVVIEAGGRYIAVDPEFWREFEKSVSELATEDPGEACGLLGSKKCRLFKALVDAGYIFYDRIAGRWVISLP